MLEVIELVWSTYWIEFIGIGPIVAFIGVLIIEKFRFDKQERRRLRRVDS